LKISDECLHCLDKRTRKPIREFLKIQGRFKHVDQQKIRELEEYVNEMWEKLKLMYKGNLKL